MTPFRLHVLLLAAYVLLGFAVAAGDTATLRGSLIDLSGILPRFYWGAAAAVAVLSSLVLPYARGRLGVVLGIHAGAIFFVTLGCFVLLASTINFQASIDSQRAAAESAAKTTAAAKKCLRLESWSWEERPRGTLHLTVNVERGVPDPIRVGVLDVYRLGRFTDVLLPGDGEGQHVVAKLTVARVDPEPFSELQISFGCPGVFLKYSGGGTGEDADSYTVTRSLPAPTHGAAAPGVLRGL